MADVSFAVDVSNNQASHQPWKSFGVHMGIAKASEGQHSRDAWFARHLADITAAGLVRGAYHFAWPNQSETVEAANYIEAVRAAATARPMVHILDLEPYPNGAKNYTGATDAEIRAYATAWVAAVKRAFPGQRVLCYTPRDAVARHFPVGADGYWYPAYPVQGRPFAAAATLARPSVGGSPVWGWQFASVPRDQTVIYMSPAALAAWAGGTPEDDMPAPDVWNYKIPTSPDKGAASSSAAVLLRGTHADVAYLNTLVHQVIAQQAADSATIKALVGLVGSASDTDAIVTAVRAASEAGAAAALAGVLTVDVNVNRPDGDAPEAS